MWRGNSTLSCVVTIVFGSIPGTQKRRLAAGWYFNEQAFRWLHALDGEGPPHYPVKIFSENILSQFFGA